MSFSGPASGITFAGLGSGMDTEGIIARILSLQKIPIQRLQIDQAVLRQQLGATEQYKSLIGKLRDAASTLNSASAFNAVKSVSSKPDVATISATSSALPGTFELAVSKLAQAHKIASAAQTDSTSALGLSGTFLVNGKAVTIAANDSLSAVATKINQASAGVTASIINGGTGNVFLTLTANASGAKNKLSFSDVGAGTVLQSLGVASGAATISHAITNGAESNLFADSVTAVGTLLNITVPSGNIQINGFNVAVDFSTDSLGDIAANINAAGTGATASVVSEEKNGTTYYKLQITGGSTPTFTDANGMLQNLGILQRAPGTEMLVAQDAEFTLDNIGLTSASNSVTGVIAGATITLLRANETTPETTTMTLTRDAEAVKGKVDEFVSAYNAVRDFLEAAASFDAESLVGGPLFGNSTVSLIQDQIFAGLLQSPPGLNGTYRNLLAIGIDFDSKGRMSLDSAKLEAALSTNLENVIGLFTEAGKIDDPDITFISASAKTRSSGLTGYEVVITQLATFGTFTAGTAHTAPSTQTETITFNGNLFGSTPYNLTVQPGSTIDDLINQINTDSKLKDLVTASKTGSDELVITSKKYGTPGNFTVKSDLVAGADNSGIGDTEVEVTGLNVEGTINGEAATGSGQYLTGNSGNANTDGLQLLIAGGALGSRGTLVYTKGAATVVKQSLDTALDFVNGFLTAETQGVQTQIDDIDERIKSLNEGISRQEQILRQKFSAMEEALARLQAQTGQLSSLLQSVQARR